MYSSSYWSRCFSLTCLCLIGLLLVGGAAFAQSNTSIDGIVKDPQDKVVSNATVTLTSTTGAVRTQKTNETGAYHFELLKPGDYRLEVQAQGFRKAIFESVHALIDKPVNLDVSLQVGASTEEITISAEGAAALVNTQDASLGNNFISQQITQLPLESKNVLSLISLQAGVTKDGYVAGAREDQSNVTLDGVDINEAQSNAIGAAQTYTDTPEAEKGPVLRLNSEGIEEFRVATATDNATGGRGSGAQITLVTKSGTNTVHGSAFWQNRNTLFSANDYFNNLAGIKKPTLNRNTYGGGVGGPIIKNRLFFFYSYEGRKDASKESVVNIVPLAHLGQGIVNFHTSDANNACSLSSVNIAQLNQIFPDVGGMNAAALSAINAAATAYPANDTTVGDNLNTGGFRFNAPTPVSLNSHAVKFDLNLTSHQTLFVRGNVIYDHYVGVPRYPNSSPTSEWDHPTGIAIGHTWTIGQNLVNNFRFGLTRQAFTKGGDLAGNSTRFRFIFQPANDFRDLSRVTPVYSWVDDLSWVKGHHTVQIGFQFQKQNNLRTNFANAWDDAVTNPSFYATGAIRTPLSNYVNSTSGGALSVYSGDLAAAENAITALIGRFTQYSANFTYGSDLNLTPSGTPTSRNFATQGYEGYIQDIWKIRPSLTITGGLRYSLWRPIYETNGFEAAPDITLSEFLARRAAGAASGVPYNEPLTVNLAGPSHNAPNMYKWDKKNFQPRLALAWSPSSSNGWLTRLLGKQGDTVIRSGFSVNGDYFGQALAAFFDSENTLGFGSQTTISANTYNVGCTPYQNASSKYFGAPGACTGTKLLGPAFTAYGQDVRGLPGISISPSITFPQSQPLDNARRIEASLDGDLTTPKSYSWSLTFERQLPKQMVLSVSYLGRTARHLLLQRDAMALGNLVDPLSKVDWYTAGTMLAKLYNQHTGIDASGDFTNPAAIASIPYFENLFPGLADNLGYPSSYTATQAAYADLNDEGGDFTTMQSDIDNYSNVGTNAFYNPQYGALTAFSTVGNSSYNALAVPLRQRLSSLTLDFNYTYSHSIDDASGLQSAASYDGTAFILNPFRQRDNRASSDFDMRHQINANAVWQIPFGKGRRFLSDLPSVGQGIIGNWQLSTIFRWNTGMPIGFYDAPGVFDDARWATNWEVQSNAVPLTPVKACPGLIDGQPNLFACNQAGIYHNFRNPYPGETGPRNYFRVPGYVSLDFGLGKTFHLSGITSRIPETHTLQFRWEVFNATNTQRWGNFDGSRTGFGVQLFPSENEPSSTFGNFRKIQGSPRVMQFGLRYSF